LKSGAQLHVDGLKVTVLADQANYINEKLPQSAAILTHEWRGCFGIIMPVPVDGNEASEQLVTRQDLGRSHSA